LLRLTTDGQKASCSLSATAELLVINIIECQWEIACDQSNGAIFNDSEWRFQGNAILTLNISEMVHVTICNPTLTDLCYTMSHKQRANLL